MTLLQKGCLTYLAIDARLGVDVGFEGGGRVGADPPGLLDKQHAHDDSHVDEEKDGQTHVQGLVHLQFVTVSLGLGQAGANDAAQDHHCYQYHG